MEPPAVEKPSLPSIKYILGDADPLFDSHRPLPPSNGKKTKNNLFTKLDVITNSDEKKQVQPLIIMRNINSIAYLQ
jgi:hypothetical protein